MLAEILQPNTHTHTEGYTVKCCVGYPATCLGGVGVSPLLVAASSVRGPKRESLPFWSDCTTPFAPFLSFISVCTAALFLDLGSPPLQTSARTTGQGKAPTEHPSGPSGCPVFANRHLDRSIYGLAGLCHLTANTTAAYLGRKPGRASSSAC